MIRKRKLLRAVTQAEIVRPPNPYPHKCGAGRGEACCIFLTAGGGGFHCERFGPLDEALRHRAPTMNARRIPGDETPYPDCMIFPDHGESEDTA